MGVVSTPINATISIEARRRSSAGLHNGKGCGNMCPERPSWQTATHAHRRYLVDTHSICSSESSPTICGMGVVPTPLDATISIAVRRRSSAGLRVRWQNFKWLKREGCWAFGDQNWVHVGLVGTPKSAMTALGTRSLLKVTTSKFG